MQKPEGYRLQYAEIFNWGTFDENIWKLNPNGKNSLLTGANGSGKTTLVDAILTLLVPPRGRHYNQSSGAVSKRERSEKTYVRGAYTTVQSESGLAAQTKYLRTKDDFSILLGVFYNAITKDYMTLAQVRYFSNNDLRRSYLIAPTALTIQDHFFPMDTGGVWKKRLKKATKAEEFDSFTKYAQVFSKKFGLKSDKALTLFAQTVGIKVLGNLNDFIRQNMLEEYDAEAEFVDLREHYENLLSSHLAIEKTREQLKLLTPIVEEGVIYHSLQKEVKELRTLEENVAPYFTTKRVDLLEDATKGLQADLDKKTNQIEDIRNDLEQLNTQRTDLQIAVRSNQAFEQIQNLDKQIKDATTLRDQRKSRAEKYNSFAESVDWKTDPNETTFYKNLEKSRKEIEGLELQSEEIAEASTELQIQLSAKSKKYEELRIRLASLAQRQNRIPLAQVKMRRKILDKLDIAEKDMPFAGELMKLKKVEEAHERAIELALRPLAISILVQEKHYEEVLGIVHRNDWEGKISFRKVDENLIDLKEKPSKNSILHKLELRESHSMHAWLNQTLVKGFDFNLVKGYARLGSDERTINEKGFFKNRRHHEKDDGNFTPILGWDNQSTVLAVQKEVKEVKNEGDELKESIERNRKTRRSYFARRDDLTRLISFEQYSEIDWKSPDKNAKQFEQDKKTFLGSSNQLKDLEDSLTTLKAHIRKIEDNRDKLVEQRGNLLNRIENFKKQLIDSQDFLKDIKDNSFKKYEKQIKTYFEGERLMISTISKIENGVTRQVTKQKEEKNKAMGRSERKLSLSMQKFVSPAQEILEKYPNWSADVVNFRVDLNYLKEYEGLYNKIRQEDLPKYQKRFKDWLNERLIFDIANFKTSLENKEVQILESIEQINDSLKDIDFNATPLTYIQLDIHKSRDIAIREFKEMLKDAMPDPTKLVLGDEKELEKSFKRIQRIIEELSNNEPWRKKVTDVRNWLEFAAIERYREDDGQRQYYVDSQSLSGGEKAKLAYTILASAIAYQFGIRNKNASKKSFRFAVVDEAFSKVDPENAVYAMELFKQLNLQLMVITPLDKINLAEPYIHAVHYVQNKKKRNSEVFDLPMEVYQEKKKEFRND